MASLVDECVGAGGGGTGPVLLSYLLIKMCKIVRREGREGRRERERER